MIPIPSLAKSVTLATLAVATLFSFDLPAGEPPTNLAPNDWLQLWPRTNYDAWFNKPESELQKLADAGQPAAQFALYKKWCRTRKEQAEALLDAAVKSGLPQAVHERGFEMFIDLSPNREMHLKGWAMMEQAAVAGYPEARRNVAEYDAGFIDSNDPQTHVPLLKPNLSRAVDYFRDLARIGHTPSMVHLALLYSSGIGEPRNASDSPHNLLLTAARKGNSYAMYLLSDRYVCGHGEPVDILESARWQYLAMVKSSKGSYLLDDECNPKAQDTLAKDELARTVALFVKVGQSQDAAPLEALAQRYLAAGQPGRSVALYRLAKTRGSSTATTELARLEPTLSPEQRAQADDKIWPALPEPK